MTYFEEVIFHPYSDTKVVKLQIYRDIIKFY